MGKSRTGGGDDFVGFAGDGDDLADEADVAIVVASFWGRVVDGAGARVGGDAVLVDGPSWAERLRVGCPGRVRTGVRASHEFPTLGRKMRAEDGDSVGWRSLVAVWELQVVEVVGS